WLIYREARRISCYFEKHASRFSEIYGMKIFSINYWRNVQSYVSYVLPPLPLLQIIGSSPGYVVHCADAYVSVRAVRGAENVDDTSRLGFSSFISESVILFFGWFET